jgi:proline iminopeptidase
VGAVTDSQERRTESWARWVAAAPDGHRVRRPITPDGSDEFDLTYVRTGPRGGLPVLVLPGGPGVASVLPYRALRRLATARCLDMIMVEHRGVGLSRRDDAGRDLPPAAVTVELVVADLAAVLDHASVERAVVYGTSYGSYLAQGFGVRHPDRVAGMVLDSPMFGARDLPVVRAHLRGLLWDGTTPATAGVAALLRALVADGVVAPEDAGAVVPVVYEFAGPRVLGRLLTNLRDGRAVRTWEWVAGLGPREAGGPGTRFLMEPDLVAGIAYGELDYGAPADGHPLDPQVVFAAAAAQYPQFAGEPYDLPATIGAFDWPTAVVSGERDLRTPRPRAEEIVERVPDAVLVPLPGLGHSALDTHALAALHIAHAVVEGAHQRLPALAPRIAALPGRGASGYLGHAIAAGVAVERWAPRRRPRWAAIRTCVRSS